MCFHGEWFIDVYQEWIDQRLPDDRRSITHQIKDGNPLIKQKTRKTSSCQFLLQRKITFLFNRILHYHCLLFAWSKDIFRGNKKKKKPLQRDIKGCCFPVKCTGQMPRCVPFCWLLFRECQVQPGYGLTHFWSRPSLPWHSGAPSPPHRCPGHRTHAHSHTRNRMRRLQDCNKMKFLVLNVLATAGRMEADRLGVTHLRNYADPSSSRVQRSTNYNPCLFPTKVLLPPHTPLRHPHTPPRPKPQTPGGSHPGCLNLQRGWRNRSPRGNASRRVNPSPAVPAAPLRRQRGPARGGGGCYLPSAGVPAAFSAACCRRRRRLAARRRRRRVSAQDSSSDPPLFMQKQTHTHTAAHTHTNKKKIK